jgi:hypothetical protein
MWVVRGANNWARNRSWYDQYGTIDLTRVMRYREFMAVSKGEVVWCVGVKGFRSGALHLDKLGPS